MSKILKRKYKRVRKEFKRDLYAVAKDNKAFVVMIVETYRASKHKIHIMKIWSLLGHNHKEAYREYCDELMGKHLTGRDEIMHSLYFADREIYEKYVYKIPEKYAMGDALAVAYKVFKQQKK